MSIACNVMFYNLFMWAYVPPTSTWLDFRWNHQTCIQHCDRRRAILGVAKANSKGNAQSDDELNSAADALTSDVNRFVAIAMNSVDDAIGVASVVGEEVNGNQTVVMEVATEDNNSNTRRDWNNRIEL